MIKILRFSAAVSALVILLTGEPLLAQWTIAPPLNVPRQGARAVALNGLIYVMGGTTTGGDVINSVEVYNPASGQWDNSVVMPMNNERSNFAAVAFDGLIYVSGGNNDLNEVMDETEVYDPSGNSWMEVEDMRRKRSGHVLGVINDYVVAAGGLDEHGAYELEIEYYDASDDDWENTETDLITGRAAPFYVFVAEDLYICGGIFNFPQSDSYYGAFDTQWSIVWNTAAPLSQARANGASVMLGNRLYMLGGITSAGGSSNLSEIYYTGSGTVEMSVPLTMPRIGCTAAALSDTSFLLIGGYESDPAVPMNRVERFVISPVGIRPGLPAGVPVKPLLVQGYPNPFNGRITLRTELDVAGEYGAAIYDITGRKVRSYGDTYRPAGSFELHWDGRDDNGQSVGSGLYVFTYNHNGQTGALKLIYSR